MSDHPHSSAADAVTRRRFVQYGAAMAAAGSLPLLTPRAARAANGGLSTLKVGLVGCGGRGSGAVRQALNADPDAIVTALADVWPERVEACAAGLQNDDALTERVHVDARSRFTGIDAYQALIDSGVDVVLLATPPVFRPMHLRYAIERGKHVFCEKPVAVDGPGLRSVLDSARMAREKSLSLVSGFCWRYHAPQRAFWNEVTGGRLGEVRAIQSTYNTGPLGDVAREPGMSDLEWQLRNWKAFTWCSGDHIVEQAIHAIDWIHWGMNGALPERAFATGGRLCRDGEWTGNMYDHFSVVYEYANGARGYHMCRQMPNCDNDNSAFVMGSRGTGTSNPWNPRSLRIEGDDPWRFSGASNDMYQQEHDELFASIRSGTVMNDGEWMTHSTAMGIMGRMAAYTGRTISWEQCMTSERSLTPDDWTWGERAFPAVPRPTEREPG